MKTASIPLHTRILLALFLGALAGLAVHSLAGEAQWTIWLTDNIAAPVGEIFLRLLLMTVVPLVFASIVLGVTGLGDVRNLGRVGGKTLVYFVASSAIAAALGIILVNLMDPGSSLDPLVRAALLEDFRDQASSMQAGSPGFGVDMLVNIVPRNPVEAAANMDMLAVIFFALVFGVALALIPRERAAPLIAVIESLGDVVIKIIEMVMRLAPYGVFALIFVVTSRFGWSLLAQLGVYVVLVLLGLTLHTVVTLSLLVKFFGGMKPLDFWRRSRAVIVTAFATSSSSATLPTSIAVAERELKVPPTLAGFVLPLGATMNMNGTAVYVGITVLFLAQVFGVDLTLGQQVVVAMLGVITAIGAAGVPGGSLPLIMVILASVGVPPEGIAIILGVDRILDMARTVTNVTGDLTAAVFLAHSETSRAGPTFENPAVENPASESPAPAADNPVSRQG
ncbi:dicarboxylate/amino acid:cation symporter [Chromatocurvus halotolerans]|uniref:DAACS family dicarboxylate/amino acid:cation (Na+ or H+) symporter n=1 Tax=Chromatocurvus halotolerans TaxID=1132028 RepID=A0A4R2KVF1_9GAMM|nr:dicarboxylate/amino acid:cation symporter [Chromatocurvus halotolerans]TCO78471.1 DAACS family dicarboxylate/amino acid:cation (Na+ or H+) symporter [Chromatocurvus halotolerans]